MYALKVESLQNHKWRRKPAWLILLLLASINCNSCVIAYSSDFTLTYGAATPCTPSGRDWSSSWCILEFPEFGYLAVGARSGGTADATTVHFRLAPRQVIEARWSSNEITVVDLGNKTSERKSVFDTGSVIGGDPEGHFNNYVLVGYGRRIESQITIKPIIRNVEFRFPPVIAGEMRVPIPPVQVRETLRIPIPMIMPSR